MVMLVSQEGETNETTRRTGEKRNEPGISKLVRRWRAGTKRVLTGS
jgi:hypothetical protein